MKIGLLLNYFLSMHNEAKKKCVILVRTGDSAGATADRKEIHKKIETARYCAERRGFEVIREIQYQGPHLDPHGDTIDDLNILRIYDEVSAVVVPDYDSLCHRSSPLLWYLIWHLESLFGLEVIVAVDKPITRANRFYTKLADALHEVRKHILDELR
jgi:hypothetical protein